MIIKPRVKDYLCLTAHPEGCKKNVEDQIAYVKAQGEIPGDAKKVLVIGCSTGYGLASRIVAAFGCHADTLGIMFERPSNGRKTASLDGIIQLHLNSLQTKKEFMPRRSMETRSQKKSKILRSKRSRKILGKWIWLYTALQHHEEQHQME